MQRNSDLKELKMALESWEILQTFSASFLLFCLNLTPALRLFVILWPSVPHKVQWAWQGYGPLVRIMVHQRYQWIFAQTGFIGSFDWCTMIRVILDHWSYLGSYQRNTPYINVTYLINANLHCFCRPTGGSNFFGAGRYKPDQLTEAVGTSLFNISWSTNWFIVQICN